MRTPNIKPTHETPRQLQERYEDDKERKRALRMCVAVDMAFDSLAEQAGIADPFGITHEFPTIEVPQHKIAVKCRGKIARIEIPEGIVEPTAEFAAETAARLFRAWRDAS